MGKKSTLRRRGPGAEANRPARDFDEFGGTPLKLRQESRPTTAGDGQNGKFAVTWRQ